jgi:hypothetical protein
MNAGRNGGIQYSTQESTHDAEAATLVQLEEQVTRLSRRVETSIADVQSPRNAREGQQRSSRRSSQPRRNMARLEEQVARLSRRVETSIAELAAHIQSAREAPCDVVQQQSSRRSSRQRRKSSVVEELTRQVQQVLTNGNASLTSSTRPFTRAFTHVHVHVHVPSVYFTFMPPFTGAHERIALLHADDVRRWL